MPNAIAKMRFGVVKAIATGTDANGTDKGTRKAYMTSYLSCSDAATACCQASTQARRFATHRKRS